MALSEPVAKAWPLGKNWREGEGCDLVLCWLLGAIHGDCVDVAFVSSEVLPARATSHVPQLSREGGRGAGKKQLKTWTITKVYCHVLLSTHPS